MLDEMYRAMQSCVLFNCNYSQLLKLRRGVRQGGVLSAVLYLVYINDLLREIRRNKCGCVLLDIEISSSVQADDIALIATSEYGMQCLINICESYSREVSEKIKM